LPLLASFLRSAEKEFDGAVKEFIGSGLLDVLNRKRVFGIRDQRQIMRAERILEARLAAPPAPEPEEPPPPPKKIDYSKPPKFKLQVVYEGVDNSIAAQQARGRAMKEVAEEIQDNAANGSIAERHIRGGWEAHTKVDKVRELFYEHQDALALKRLIEPKHRFIG
jgi:hypothetical protein